METLAPSDTSVANTNAGSGRFDPALSLATIKPSKTNPRKVFAEMDRLTASVKSLGILAPILVRPIGDGTRFELVFGERRFRAAKAAGLTVAPAMIREFDDAQMIEAQVTENSQRVDVHPIEEAAGVMLLKSLGMDDETIALKLGWSHSYAVSRMRLTHLCKEFRDLWLKDESGITIKHATLFARMSEPQQVELLAELQRHYDWPSNLLRVEDLKRRIYERFQRHLSTVAWNRDDADLVPAAGACNACPHRTGFQKALFEDVDPKNELCLKPECYASKASAFVALRVAAVKASGAEPVLMSTGYGRDRPKGAVGPGDVIELTKKEADKLPKSQVVDVVVLDGEDAGREFKARPVTVAPALAKKRNDAAAQQRKLEEKATRDTAMNHAVLTAVLEEADPRTDKAQRLIAINAVDRLSYDDQKRLAKRHGWEKPKRAAINAPWIHDVAEDHVDGLRGESIATFTLECTLLPHCHCAPSTFAVAASGGTKRLHAAAKLLGADVDDVREKFNAAEAAGESPAKAVAKASIKKAGKKARAGK